MVRTHKMTLAVLLFTSILVLPVILTGCVATLTSRISQSGETADNVTTLNLKPSPDQTEPIGTGPSVTESQPDVSPTTSSSISQSTETTTAKTNYPADDVFLKSDQAVGLVKDRVGNAARVLSVEAEFDDNPPVYEIELIDDQYHYEIEIHAITGAILEYERTHIDD